jgi:raffinose/stachyose/melibiose transport system substrate-binding protein
VITLRVLNYLDLSAANAMEEVNFVWDTFAANNPGIKVEREDEFNDPFHNKVEAYAAQGNLPDVIYAWPSGRSSTLHNNKQLKDLTPLIQRDGLDKIFDANALNPGLQAGGYVGMLPRGVTYTNTFWVNKEVLDAVGLSPAKTYSELKGQVETLKAAGYQTVMMPNVDTWVMQSCLYSLLAGRFMGEGWEGKILGGSTDFTDPKFLASLEFVKDLYDSGVIDPAQSLYLQYGEAPGQFATNKAAYYIDGDWRVGDFVTGDDPLIPVDRQGNFEVTVFPDIDSPWSVAFNKSNSGVPSTGWGISAALADGSPELEAAWTLVKWLSSKEVHEFLLKSGGISGSSRNDIDWNSLDLSPLQMQVVNLTSKFDTVTVVIDGAFDGDVYNPLNDALQAIGQGSMTPEQAASATQTAFDGWKNK